MTLAQPNPSWMGTSMLRQEDRPREGMLKQQQSFSHTTLAQPWCCVLGHSSTLLSTCRWWRWDLMRVPFGMVCFQLFCQPFFKWPKGKSPMNCLYNSYPCCLRFLRLVKGLSVFIVCAGLIQSAEELMGRKKAQKQINYSSLWSYLLCQCDTECAIPQWKLIIFWPWQLANLVFC